MFTPSDDPYVRIIIPVALIAYIVVIFAWRLPAREWRRLVRGGLDDDERIALTAAGERTLAREVRTRDASDAERRRKKHQSMLRLDPHAKRKRTFLFGRTRVTVFESVGGRPLGSVVWDGAIMLCTHAASSAFSPNYWRGKRVLELGGTFEFASSITVQFASLLLQFLYSCLHTRVRSINLYLSKRNSNIYLRRFNSIQFSFISFRFSHRRHWNRRHFAGGVRRCGGVYRPAGAATATAGEHMYVFRFVTNLNQQRSVRPLYLLSSETHPRSHTSIQLHLISFYLISFHFISSHLLFSSLFFILQT
jgi:hypothetical protein